MPENAPASITVRMYNVGFGDCFLLTFHYPTEKHHMLIDFGSAATPRNAPKDHMRRVAQEIVRESKGKLHVLVATHRHRDHISGFATDGAATGKMIAGLRPDHVILPWTEDPDAAADALAPTPDSSSTAKPDAKLMRARFLRSLDDMHSVAASVQRFAQDPEFAGRDTRAQLDFLGQDNLKNSSAVENLIAMGKRAKAHYVHAGMKLDDLLPGVRITVLGPPTLQQSDAIRKQRASDASEFWQFCNFWGARRTAAKPHSEPTAKVGDLPPNVRWFIRQSRQILADGMLELVRELDSVLNNTSVILLLEAGGRKLLFPGDAQIENWTFALSNLEWRKLLSEVDLYKVGHHGSLNATPKSLWSLFQRKASDPAQPDRLRTLCSTRSGKHGSAKSGTEVPRHTLVEELRGRSDFISTEDSSKTDCYTVEIKL